MGCTSCSSNSRGNYNDPNEKVKGCGSATGTCSTGGCNKLNVFDWLSNMELPSGQPAFDVVEVRFKNSRKEFFKNVNNLTLSVGDVIAVEASPGHDIGVVSAVGELVRLQLKKKKINHDSEEVKKVYRKAKQQDIDKWQEAQKLETETMYKARTFALHHGLQMKISDVEYQGDKTKAIFYYTADARVDFRQLIKTLAEEFKVRVEMRQIGARQEAGRLGAIGSCGRELCCSTWLTDFRSVSTSAARYQQLSLNPLKLAGQCGKLKCCLNYELDSYLDAIKDFPNTDHLKLRTKKGIAFHQKTDIFKRLMWFTYEGEFENFIPVTVDTVKEVIEMNKAGNFPEELAAKVLTPVSVEVIPDYENVVGMDSLTRFDKAKKPQHKGNRSNPNQKGNKPKPQNPNQQKQGPNPSNNANQGGPKPPNPPKNNPNPANKPQHNKPGNQPKPQNAPQNKPHGLHRKKPNNNNNRPNPNTNTDKP
ncbi:MAG: regulatory iron-sulfur-containing complex subunit RicT [Bacteroidota bacterium]|nr:regulatory iron-sulfur-containing complex subunit RicT [Bacteroidota bacterium]